MAPKSELFLIANSQEEFDALVEKYFKGKKLPEAYTAKVIELKDFEPDKGILLRKKDAAMKKSASRKKSK
jgi:hypothetical protein